MLYEYHNDYHYNDPELKVILHYTILESKNNYSQAHWHKSPEFLLVVSGKLKVFCDGVESTYENNELAIFNSNQVHDMSPEGEKCKYYCLIIDSEMFDNINISLPNKSINKEAIEIYKKIVKELTDKKENYKEAVIGYTKVLITLLSREKVENNINPKNKRKVKLVKNATQYIFENLSKDITLDEISKHLNISKFYLSRIFKEITGNTVVSHMNYIRCNHAKSLLKSGKYNVAESAYASGFTNLSYFSKTYKSIMGNSPIKDIKC